MFSTFDLWKLASSADADDSYPAIVAAWYDVELDDVTDAQLSDYPHDKAEHDACRWDY